MSQEIFIIPVLRNDLWGKKSCLDHHIQKKQVQKKYIEHYNFILSALHHKKCTRYVRILWVKISIVLKPKATLNKSSSIKKNCMKRIK